MVTYGTTSIPSDQITVRAGGTVNVSAAFERTSGIIGGMDTANGSATEGEVVQVESLSDAADKFGDGSELYEQVRLAFLNGSARVYALPLTETSVTGEVKSSQDGTLDNAPVFDPRVNDEHDITVTDTGAGSADVVLVDEPPTSAPTTSETVEVYPPTGEYYADATPDGDYEFDYSYGSFTSSEMVDMVNQSPRIIGLCTEADSPLNTLMTDVNDSASSFDFMQVVSGEQVSIPDPATYTNSVDERRASKVYSSRGYTDDAETNEVRTVGAVAGYLSSLALGVSATNDSLAGFTALKNEVGGVGDAGDLIDIGIMPLIDYPPVTIVKDMTTSSEPKFERVYAMQVVDEATELSHEISREFIGDQNTAANRRALRRSHRNAYIGMRDGVPRQLDDFVVNVSEDSSDPNQVNVEIGLDVVDVIDVIDVTITVGDIVRNTGAA